MVKKAVAKKKKKTVVASKNMQKNKQKKSAKKVAVKPKKKVSAIPKGYSSITPYFIFSQAKEAINFYKQAFAAKENMRLEHTNGKVAHAELKIGDSRIMLADECPEMNAHGPKKFGGSPMMIHLYVKDSDAIVAKAVSLGAKLIRAPQDQFYGDRSGMIEDPFGYQWCVSTHIEDVTPGKMKKRAAELFGKK